MKFGLALGAAVLLALAAFRRARNVLSPRPNRSIARPAQGSPPGQARTALATAVLAVAAVGAVAGIVWAALELFT